MMIFLSYMKKNCGEVCSSNPKHEQRKLLRPVPVVVSGIENTSGGATYVLSAVVKRTFTSCLSSSIPDLNHNKNSSDDVFGFL